MSKPRLIVADDHSMFVDGLRVLLESEVDLVETVGDGRALLEAVDRIDPDIVVVDISMPRLNGLDATRELKKSFPAVKVIVLTMHTDRKLAESAFRAGADGFVVKQSAADELLTAIREVEQNRYYLTPRVAKDVLSAFIERSPTASGGDQLTARQREVLQLIAEGCTAKEIGKELNVSPKTAEAHRYAIMKELDLHTTAELTRYAIQQGLVSLD
jgi:DNA-binding NarL/FixJ family response regulator